MQEWCLMRGCNGYFKFWKLQQPLLPDRVRRERERESSSSVPCAFISLGNMALLSSQRKGTDVCLRLHSKPTLLLGACPTWPTLALKCSPAQHCGRSCVEGWLGQPLCRPSNSNSSHFFTLNTDTTRFGWALLETTANQAHFRLPGHLLKTNKQNKKSRYWNIYEFVHPTNQVMIRWRGCWINNTKILPIVGLMVHVFTDRVTGSLQPIPDAFFFSHNMRWFSALRYTERPWPR